MSIEQAEDDYPPVCRYCGTFIEDPGVQRCPALDDGRCRP